MCWSNSGALLPLPPLHSLCDDSAQPRCSKGACPYPSWRGVLGSGKYSSASSLVSQTLECDSLVDFFSETESAVCSRFLTQAKASQTPSGGASATVCMTEYVPQGIDLSPSHLHVDGKIWDQFSVMARKHWTVYPRTPDGMVRVGQEQDESLPSAVWEHLVM